MSCSRTRKAVPVCNDRPCFTILSSVQNLELVRAFELVLVQKFSSKPDSSSFKFSSRILKVLSQTFFSKVSKRSRLWIKSSCAICAFVFRIFSWPLLRPRGGRRELSNFRAASWGRTMVLLRPCAVECPLCGDSFISRILISVRSSSRGAILN